MTRAASASHEACTQKSHASHPTIAGQLAHCHTFSQHGQNWPCLCSFAHSRHRPEPFTPRDFFKEGSSGKAQDSHRGSFSFAVSSIASSSPRAPVSAASPKPPAASTCAAETLFPCSRNSVSASSHASLNALGRRRFGTCWFVKKALFSAYGASLDASAQQ